MATYSKRGYKAQKKKQLMIQLRMEMLMKKTTADVFQQTKVLQKTRSFVAKIKLSLVCGAGFNNYWLFSVSSLLLNKTIGSGRRNVC
jgi:hypothetical protein